MELERLLELLFENPQNINIQYSNINGKEKITVNGHDLSKEEDYDDTEVKRLIKEYKDNINLLDDCTFVEVLDEMEDTINFKNLDTFMNKEHFTEEEAEFVKGQINMINTAIHEKLVNKIQEFNELLGKF